MKYPRNVTALIALTLPLIMAACTGLPGNTIELDQLKTMTPTGSPFTQALGKDYYQFADAERQEYDWPVMSIFAHKGLEAAHGTRVDPERVENWNFSHSQADEVVTLQSARVRLVAMLGTDAPDRLPDLAATAQEKFDCWVEQQDEDWQKDDIAACRKDFEDAMNAIAGKAVAASAAPATEPAPAAMAPSAYIVFFDFDKSTLRPEARAIIAGAAKELGAGHGIKVRITGFTDTVGTVPYNLKLSYRRGNAVEQELIRDGIAADRIGVDGKGKGELLVQTPDGVREPKNRRAAIEMMTE